MTAPNAPEDLRAYDQWVCYDAAKRPINPHTGQLASVTDPATWGTFDQACAAAASGRGIGFVFADSDPFTGVDLDVPEGGEPTEVQRRIFEAFPTYAERSPSGRGIHIICRGKVSGGGVRNSAAKVEVYSSGRYFTFTGDAVRDVPIADCQHLITTLCAEIAARNDAEKSEVLDRSPAREISGEALRDRICESEANRRYYDGTVSDWSAAYFALICAACLFSSDEAQVRRVVLASPLVTKAPAKNGETRLHKAERLWAKEYRRAAVRGTQERQERDDMRRSVSIDLTGQFARTFGTAPVVADGPEWFAASDFADMQVPPRLWHVRGFVPTGQVTILSGDGRTGKSLLAMQLAASTATGTQWLGADVREGWALYLSAEDDAPELYRRLSAIGDVRAMQRLTLRSLAGQDALLAAPRDRTGVLGRTPLFDALDARMTADRPALLVLDTLADFFGGNENDRAQARQFIGMLRGLAIRHECAVLLLSHPSVAGIASGGGSSGSTAWNNSVRSRLYLSRVVGNDGYKPNPDARQLTVKKSKYDRSGAQIDLYWQNGVFVGEQLATRAEGHAKAETVFLKLLAEFASQGRRVNTSGGPSYAPTAFAAHPESDGITKRAFKDAMEKLLTAGRVVLVETGPASKRRSHIEAKTDLPTLFQPPSDPENPENRPFQPPSDRGVPTPL